MKNFKADHDKLYSTYAWRIKIRPEDDYRRQKDGHLIISGFSKLRGTIEEPEKGRLLIQCFHRLRDGGYIRKADGIIIYKGDPFVNPMFDYSEAIISISRKNGKFELKSDTRLLTTSQISYFENIVFQENKMLIETLKIVK